MTVALSKGASSSPRSVTSTHHQLPESFNPVLEVRHILLYLTKYQIRFQIILTKTQNLNHHFLHLKPTHVQLIYSDLSIKKSSEGKNHFYLLSDGLDHVIVAY